MTIDEATIAALLDGSLEPDHAQRVEAEIARDQGLLCTLGELALLNCTLRRAVSVPFLARKSPAAIVADGMPQRSRWRQALPAMAAGLLAVVAAVAGFAGGRAGEDSRLETAYLEVYEAREQTLDRALESSVSGEAVAWAKPGTSWTLEVTPIRTFRTADSRWCREYRSAEAIGATTEVRLGVACRSGEGRWQTEMEQVLEG